MITAAKHLARTRVLEVSVLQASPMLGLWLAGLDVGGDGTGRALLLLLGSFTLTAHVFATNDWAGHPSDAHDPRRAGEVAGRRELAQLALVLLAVAVALLAVVSWEALLYGAGIAALSVVYSFAPRLGKSTPVAASLNHVLGGVLHFLMGYSLVRSVDTEGVVVSLFFGLVFAAGHLNQEVRDHEADRAGGIRTSAVTFGPRATFVASFLLFTSAYGLIVALAATGVLPTLMLVTGAVWGLQARWSLQALRRGLEAETALWIQRRYRLLFLVVGLLLLVR